MPRISGGRFVILGGASQVGAHVSRQLLAEGAREVILVDNLSLGGHEAMAQALSDSRCKFVQGDVRRLDDLMASMANADGVFAIAGIMASNMRENPAVGLEVNIQGVHNALEACRQLSVRKIVLSSSVGVYGLNDAVPTDETAPLRWEGTPPELALYSASKVIGEGLSRLYRELYGIDYVALRYSAVYGEHQHRRSVRGGYIAETCARLRRGEPAIVDGDGTQVQDYVYAGDVARANLLAMESELTGESFNVCGGEDVSQNRLAEIMSRVCGSTLAPQYRPVATVKLPPTKRQAYSREKAKRLLGWEPIVSLENGVGRVLRWIDDPGSWSPLAARGPNPSPTSAH